LTNIAFIISLRAKSNENEVKTDRPSTEVKKKKAFKKAVAALLDNVVPCIRLLHTAKLRCVHGRFRARPPHAAKATVLETRTRSFRESRNTASL
jgi:ribosomal protein L6P/L9E